MITGFPKLRGVEGNPKRSRAELRAVVVTLTVTEVGLVPSGVTEGDEMEQVEADGAPPHASETV
jgi:hypothetical protein